MFGTITYYKKNLLFYLIGIPKINEDNKKIKKIKI